ncbi:MAG: M48 family metallopeptidase [Oscillospiraceae bacterium]|nr:M48 family metallopeptidase [Oscillospiraceae bacterium]
MQINYRVIRSNRRTIALQITPEGGVLVRCPNRMENADIQKFVDSKTQWIERHLAGREREVRLPRLTQAQLRSLAQQAGERIRERAAYFAPLVGVSYERITIRSQRTRWGSCSGRGNLNFNCLLMLAPPEVLDYVVVHELCHRKHMNHSCAFWAEVERVLPDYAVRRRWLKDHGYALISRIPD